MKFSNKDAIRRLQKDGEYRFSGLSREESKAAATELANAAMSDDRRNGIERASESQETLSDTISQRRLTKEVHDNVSKISETL